MQPRARRAPALRLSIFLLVLFLALVILWPAGSAVQRIIAGATRTTELKPLPASFAPVLLLESLGWAGLIAGFATLLGWPVAWSVRRHGWRLAPLLITPMLMPPYLAYAGWNLLRAPDTPLGALMERAAEHGYRWLPIATGKALAILGLALWAAPAAALLTGLVLRRTDDALLDQLALDAGRGVRFRLGRARLAAPGLAASFLLITLIMLGSAVPVHLAQIPTWSINLWKVLDLIPLDEQWRLWARTWPLVLLAVAGVLLFRRIMTPGTGWAEPASRPSTAPRPSRPRLSFSSLAAFAVLALGVGGPLVLFALHLKTTRSIPMFWSISGRAIRDGLIVAGSVAVISALLIILVWSAMSASRPSTTRSGAPRIPRLISWSLAPLILAALLPGVMIGSVVARAWDNLPLIRDAAGIIILAHLARFAAIPALTGLWLVLAEPREERDLRAVDGVSGLRGWASAVWPTQAGLIIGISIAAGLLSFFEIEAAVVVQPPGLENLSRQILGFLHFSRTEEMGAAAITLIGGGLIAAVIAGWALRRASRDRPVSPAGLTRAAGRGL